MSLSARPNSLDRAMHVTLVMLCCWVRSFLTCTVLQVFILSLNDYIIYSIHIQNDMMAYRELRLPTLLLASRASGCHLDTQTLKNHPSGHPKTFWCNCLKCHVLTCMLLQVHYLSLDDYKIYSIHIENNMVAGHNLSFCGDLSRANEIQRSPALGNFLFYSV